MPAQTRSKVSSAGTVTGAMAVASPASLGVDSDQRRGVVAMLVPVPVQGTPPGSHLPGVRAAGALSRDGRFVAITRLAHAVPGHPDGEVDTPPLRPIWQRRAPRAGVGPRQAVGRDGRPLGIC